MTLNGVMAVMLRYFSEYMYDVAVKQLIGLHRFQNLLSILYNHTRMWANAQRDGRPAEHRWRFLFNAAKFG